MSVGISMLPAFQFSRPSSILSNLTTLVSLTTPRRGTTGLATVENLSDSAAVRDYACRPDQTWVVDDE
jgi:hypothetical protein